MKRRSLLKYMGVISGLAATANSSAFAASINKEEAHSKKPVLRIAHITDVHIRAGDNAPDRFKKCLEEIKKQHIDFFLNGGDSIHDASYDDVKRERVTQQWQIWDDCMSTIQSYEMYSCIGNHDSWWAAPVHTDDMYGKDYVVVP